MPSIRNAGGILHLREPRHVDVRIPLRHRLQPLARSQRLEIRFGVRRVGDQVDPVVRIRLEIGPPGPERHHTLTHAAGRNPLVVPFHARRIEYQHVEPIDARLDGGWFARVIRSIPETPRRMLSPPAASAGSSSCTQAARPHAAQQKIAQ